jgi:hypothetical protein
VVGDREGEIGTPDAQASLLEQLERAAIGAVVQEVKVNVDERRMPVPLADAVGAPQLVVEGARR